MTVVPQDKFCKSAIKIFGDKVRMITLASDLPYKWVCQNPQSPPTEEEIASLLPVIIPVDGKCPVCKDPLYCTFEWKIQHGLGYCSNCNEVEIRRYHYIRDNKIRVVFDELVGF